MRHTLSERLREVKPCQECRASEGGVWAVDQATGNVRYGVRCHCLRGQLLAKADALRNARLCAGAAA